MIQRSAPTRAGSAARSGGQRVSRGGKRRVPVTTLVLSLMTALVLVVSLRALGAEEQAAAAATKPPVDSCRPDPDHTVDVTVSFEAPYGVLVAGMSLLVDYPEGKLALDGTGRVPPERFIPVAHEGRFLIAGFDLDHAVRVVAASDKEIEPGALARIVFMRCQAQDVPTADEIACSVIEASDPFQNARENVTCSVTVH
jgi:hypothetical protein